MPIENIEPLEIELITLINSFRNTISLNNLLIKEKIIRKLEMIHTMRYYGLPIMNFPVVTSNKIINQLRSIDKEGDIVKYSNATNNSDTNKLLGEILHNAYQASGYNMILSNAPTHGTTVEGKFIQLDCEAIYDTLTQYAPVDAVQAICQISADTYLIKMVSNENAIVLCNLLNEKLLEGRIIKVEYIEPLTNGINLVRNKEISKIEEIDKEIETTNYNIMKKAVKKSNYYEWIYGIVIAFMRFTKILK